MRKWLTGFTVEVLQEVVLLRSESGVGGRARSIRRQTMRCGGRFSKLCAPNPCSSRLSAS
jgi:hypothetical protein